MSRQYFRGVVVLLLIFCLSIWAVKQQPEQITEQPEQVEHTADHFAVTYSKMTMGDNGFPKSKLVADFVVHYADINETELTNPVLTMFKTDSPPWLVRAKTGLIADGGENIFLAGKVFIDRLGTENTREVKITTSNLTVQPDRNYAETDEQAELISGLDRITGVGMRLYYQEPLYIELLSHVKGKHVYE